MKNSLNYKNSSKSAISSKVQIHSRKYSIFVLFEGERHVINKTLVCEQWALNITQVFPHVLDKFCKCPGIFCQMLHIPIGSNSRVPLYVLMVETDVSLTVEGFYWIKLFHTCFLTLSQFVSDQEPAENKESQSPRGRDCQTLVDCWAAQAPTSQWDVPETLGGMDG